MIFGKHINKYYLKYSPILLLGLLWTWELDGIWFNFVGVNCLAAVLSVILLRRLAGEIRKKESEKNA